MVILRCKVVSRTENDDGSWDISILPVWRLYGYQVQRDPMVKGDRYHEQLWSDEHTPLSLRGLASDAAIVFSPGEEINMELGGVGVIPDEGRICPRRTTDG